MKSKRHGAILKIIETNNVETQDELMRFLKEEGFEVTQATISRDIRELKLTKATSPSGVYKYEAPREREYSDSDIYLSSLKTSVKSTSCAQNIVVIKTYPGLSHPVAAAVDSMEDRGILGCVAGDDTVIVVTEDNDSALELAGVIDSISRG